MYNVDVIKDDSGLHRICVVPKGLFNNDCIIVDDATLVYLCNASMLLLSGDVVAAPTQGNVTLESRGNRYMLTVKINDSYIKGYNLTEKELKLFLASLKRAVG